MASNKEVQIVRREDAHIIAYLMEGFFRDYRTPLQLFITIFPKTYHAARRSRLSEEEITQCCYEGMLVAARRYDGRAKYLTYAAAWMRASVNKQLKKATKEFSAKQFNDIDMEMFLNSSAVKLGKCLRQREVDENESRSQVGVFAKSILTPREYEVLCLRYGLEGRCFANLKEIGKMFNLSKERVRQIQFKALSRLRAAIRSKQRETGSPDYSDQLLATPKHAQGDPGLEGSDGQVQDRGRR